MDESSQPGSPSRAASANLGKHVPNSRVDRLLLQRLRKSQSGTTLYGDNLLAPEELQEPSVYQPHTAQHTFSQRLIVVANRLPVSASKDKHGEWELQEKPHTSDTVSAGGLVSALMGVQSFKTCWIGWPGVYVDEGPDRDKLTAALARENYIPVYMDHRTVDLHYNGFCNSVLWQLFHYVPLNMDSKLSETRTLNFQWKAHQAANKQFADVVFQHYQEGDMVWVQDYHLMLLPALLKNRKPKMKVGWFLHTPFPSSEIYRTLPVREEVLRAVLKADLIGFHTYDYARHFVSACTRILGLEGTPEGVEDSGWLTRVAAFPIGIQPERFVEALERPDVKGSIAGLLTRYAGRKIMLGVDRLDMIKGIPQKLLAFEKFLEEHPEWRDKVLLVQIAVPTRGDVPEYQQLRRTVHEVVGRINGHYGTLTHVPIHHLDRQLSFHELCALYAITDVLLVTSLRDGMNLVSYEYVACQTDNAGVLVLSEFAGAAQSLGAGAILVNPWNITDLANAIDHSLTMSDVERRERHRQNYMHITIHTSQTWADTFISELNDTHVEAELRTKHIPPALPSEEVVMDFKKSKRRLLVLGYNSTLTTAVEAPRQPKNHYDQIKALTDVNPTIYDSIRTLSEDPHTDVVIFSGSDRTKLDETFGKLNVWLAAENGMYLRSPLPQTDGIGWTSLVDMPKMEWKESVNLVFDYFCERTPRSFVEARDTSIVWNYKYADVEFGRLQARDLLQHLWTGPISNAPVDIVQGSKSVEVRPVGFSKGLAMHRILEMMAEDHTDNASMDFEFVLVAGHFLMRDENIFTYFEGQGVKIDHQTRNAVQAAQGLAALQEEVPHQGDIEPANSSGRHLAHPSTRHRHSGSGSTSGHHYHSSHIARTSTGVLNPPPRRPSLEEESRESAGTRESGASEASSRGGLRRTGGVPSCLSPTQRPSLVHRHSTGNSELQHPQQGSSEHRGLQQHMSAGSSDQYQTGAKPNSQSLERHHPSVMHLPPPLLYTCTVGRARSGARYFLSGSSEVGTLLEKLAENARNSLSESSVSSKPTSITE